MGEILAMKNVLPFFLLLVQLQLAAQSDNFVRNPSLEVFQPGAKNYPTCSFGKAEIDFSKVIESWSSFNASTPDLVVWRNNDSVDCFFPKPHHGEHAVAIITYLPGLDMGRNLDFHEFVQGELRAPLVPGATYTFSFFVQQADSVGVRHLRELYHMVKEWRSIPVAAGNLGVHFTVEPEKENIRLDILKPQVLWEAPIITRQGEWRRLSATFVATEAYRFFTIGNFGLDAQTRTNQENGDKFDAYNVQMKDWKRKKHRIAYYLLDDFSVLEGADHAPPPVVDLASDLHNKKEYTFKNLHFESGEWAILPDALPELESLALFLKNNPKLRVEIGGHTDAMGQAETNRDLSEKRARSVCEFLTANGIAQERLLFQGYGESRPLAANDSPQGRLKNRRVECKILPTQ